MSPLMQAGQEPPNKSRKYPAEVLTAAEIQALIGVLGQVRQRDPEQGPDRAAVPLRAQGQ